MGPPGGCAVKGKYKEGWVALAFLAPNFAGFLLFTLGPVFHSLLMAFTNWNLVEASPTRFIGLQNFFALARSDEFWLYFINTLYLMLGIPLSILGSLCCALLLSQNVRGLTAYRTLFYIPSFTSGVALFLLWKKLLNPDFGPINAGLTTLMHGLGFANYEAPRWLASTHNLLALTPTEIGTAPSQWGLGARDAIILMGIWLTIGGNNMLLYIAGIANIPRDLFEAAEIDGAGRWHTFRHVTWPQLAPTTFFIVIMSVIGGLQGGFEQARVMTMGGPAGTTTTLSYFIYNKAFTEFQLGYASAISWLLFAFVFAATLLNWRYGSRHVTY